MSEREQQAGGGEPSCPRCFGPEGTYSTTCAVCGGAGVLTVPPSPEWEKTLALCKAASRVRDGAWIKGAPTHIFPELLRSLEQDGWTLVARVVERPDEGQRLAAQDAVIERVRAVLRPLGYAVAVHGSRQRDLDLIAAPWVEDAESDGTKIAEAFQAAEFVVGMGQRAEPHNRLGFALHGAPASAGIKYIDLSVLLPLGAEAAHQPAGNEWIICRDCCEAWPVGSDHGCECIEDHRFRVREVAP